LKLKFGHHFALLMLGFGYEVQSWSRFVSFVEMLMLG